MTELDKFNLLFWLKITVILYISVSDLTGLVIGYENLQLISLFFVLLRTLGLLSPSGIGRISVRMQSSQEFKIHIFPGFDGSIGMDLRHWDYERLNSYFRRSPDQTCSQSKMDIDLGNLHFSWATRASGIARALCQQTGRFAGLVMQNFVSFHLEKFWAQFSTSAPDVLTTDLAIHGGHCETLTSAYAKANALRV